MCIARGSAGWIWRIFFLTASITWIVFCPDWRRTSRTTASRPSSHAPLCGSSVVSST